MCAAAVSLLLSQIKDLPRAEQQALLQELHDLIYTPIFAVPTGPDYRAQAAATHGV